MEHDVEIYINGKFNDIIKTLKWIGILLVSILLSFSAVIGTNTIRSVKNKEKVERHELAIKEMVTKQQMSRLIEVSRLRKEIIMTVLGDSEADIDALWRELEELERVIVEDDYGIYFRGATGDNE